MNQVAFILENTTLYWYSIVLSLSVLTGLCIFGACALRSGMTMEKMARAMLLALVLSLLLGRILYWNCRADRFDSFGQAMTVASSGSFALAGAFLGCGLAVLILWKLGEKPLPLLDCMSLAGAGAIALGRLGNFFTASDRGQIVTDLTNLPWAYPVVNAASGMPEYRLATFVFQAIIAAVLFGVLCVLFLSKGRRDGDMALLFLLVYSASQVLLDSTRYDSLYLRSNGFVSMVQILGAVALAAVIALLALRAVKTLGLQKWMITLWAAQAALFGLAGYMEYFVQRHGRLAFFAYSVMEHCLVGIVVLTLVLWHKEHRSQAEKKAK